VRRTADIGQCDWAAEKAYRDHSRVNNRSACITVRTRDGNGVIENLWIDGQPIRKFLARK
jgi:hypothetical protein